MVYEKTYIMQEGVFMYTLNDKRTSNIALMSYIR